jgi:hypothetical protein
VSARTQQLFKLATIIHYFFLSFILSLFNNACSTEKLLSIKGENDLCWWKKICVTSNNRGLFFKYYPITGSERLRKKKGSQDCTPQDKEWCPEPSKRKVAKLINDTRNNTESGSLLDRFIVTN